MKVQEFSIKLALRHFGINYIKIRYKVMKEDLKIVCPWNHL